MLSYLCASSFTYPNLFYTFNRICRRYPICKKNNPADHFSCKQTIKIFKSRYQKIGSKFADPLFTNGKSAFPKVVKLNYMIYFSGTN